MKPQNYKVKLQKKFRLVKQGVVLSYHNTLDELKKDMSQYSKYAQTLMEIQKLDENNKYKKSK